MDLTTRKQIIGARFKELRSVNSMSAAQVAKLLDLKQRSSITDFEAGRTAPSVDVLIKAAEVFHVPTDYLLGFDGEIDSIVNIIQENKRLNMEVTKLKECLSKIHEIVIDTN